MCWSHADISSKNFVRKLVPKQLSKASKDQLFPFSLIFKSQKIHCSVSFPGTFNQKEKFRSSSAFLFEIYLMSCVGQIFFSL